MMLTKNICDDETTAAFKFEMSQLELSIKTRKYLISFSVPSNQFMPSFLRQQLSSPAKLRWSFTIEWGDNRSKNYHEKHDVLVAM